MIRNQSLVLYFSFLLLAACGGQLRAPFCTSPLQTFPASWEGTYELNIPAGSTAWGNNIVLQRSQLLISGGTLATDLTFGISPDGGSLCNLGTRYFVDQLSPNGTHSLYEVSSVAGGLMLQYFAFDRALAAAMELSIQYNPFYPQFVVSSNAVGQTPVNGLPTDSFILDNSGLTQVQTLGVLVPVSVPLFLRKMSGKPAWKAKFKYQLR